MIGGEADEVLDPASALGWGGFGRLDAIPNSGSWKLADWGETEH